MAVFTIYTKSYCPYCVKAKNLLSSRGLKYTEVDIEKDEELQAEVRKKSGGSRTVPQIFLGETHIGGCDDLYTKNSSGELDVLLGAN